MREDNHSGMRAPSAVDAPDDSCTLVVDYESGLDTFLITGIIDARVQQLLGDLPHKVRSAKVRFDFGGVKRINSMGIALLLRCFKQIKDEKHAEIRLSNLNPVNAMLFRITGVFLLAVPDEVLSQGYVQ